MTVFFLLLLSGFFCLSLEGIFCRQITERRLIFFLRGSGFLLILLSPLSFLNNSLPSPVSMTENSPGKTLADGVLLNPVFSMKEGKCFHDGLLFSGKALFTAEDGSLREESYLQGLPEGKWRKKNGAGILLHEVSYKAGKRHGDELFYDKEGRLLSVLCWVDEKLDGETRRFFPNGRPANISRWQDGLKHGFEEVRDEEGMLVQMILWHKGEELERSDYGAVFAEDR
jgi:hypothetical protein